MTQNTAILLLISLAAANLPFASDRLFFVRRPKSGHKAVIWRLLELVILYFAVGGLAWLVEKNQGEVHSQGWEFYAVTACLFLVFAFPGFVYRYLWNRHHVAR